MPARHTFITVSVNVASIRRLASGRWQAQIRRLRDHHAQLYNPFGSHSLGTVA